MKIGLDFDGVIHNSAKLKSRVCEDLYGKQLPLENCDATKLNGVISLEHYRELQETVASSEKYAKFMEAIPEAIETIKKLIADGHNVSVVTARINNKLNIARTWLKEQGVEILFEGVGQDRSKKEKCEECDVYIDDTAKLLEDLNVKHKFLFSWPYNTDKEGFNRVNNWSEFYEEINKIGGTK
ncbi:hypothetical protein HN592_00845 [Candidatus Woesearchaeota archaeon]|jgi:5'(3')-deoxyribonucleotidase|nr:hypothetical protein [Candidatus Woesearchaeota archaeon]MBT4368851.1 hypothetical protein [Candidatus Woesearchaeota archaeon]MBT4712140.1 hypothetical protein [Candidatus Woesearchaeota archaeon]MBT6639112.1 hypothetical protein [Candidatus Woesearchaeota archaeon]MBT7134312.1 hypothetical protein [Candidatus Woesearchaeota archaeon]